MYENEPKQTDHQLKSVDREQDQLLQWALKGFPENQVEVENKRLNNAGETLKSRQAEFEAKLKASRDAVINVPGLEKLIDEV